MPMISGRVRASSTSAWPNGAGFVACPSAAIEAIIDEVVSFTFFGAGAVVSVVLMMRSSRRRARRSRAAIRAPRRG